MGEGTVFTDVCLSTRGVEGRGYPWIISAFASLSLLPGQDRGAPPPPYPFARREVPPTTGQGQGDCASRGGMPVAFTQEDFLRSLLFAVQGGEGVMTKGKGDGVDGEARIMEFSIISKEKVQHTLWLYEQNFRSIGTIEDSGVFWCAPY